jgi:hypothetical protein
MQAIVEGSLHKERWLLHTKHKYGYTFPIWKCLELNHLPNIAENDDQYNFAGKDTISQQTKLFHTMSISNRAIAIIQSLLNCFNARIFTSENFFMLEIDQCADRIPPGWASHFDKMKGIIREQGRLIVQIPSKKTALSIPAWHKGNHPYLCFIDAVYTCRRSSTRLAEDIFTDVLGESEQKIATNLHAILIASLGILSIVGGDGLIEKIVTAILGTTQDPVYSASSDNVLDNWQVRNRRQCPCNANIIHRPLSPLAAAKAVGVDIWRIRQKEKVTRVWDLDKDMLVSNIDATEVIFVTHKWGEAEADYQDVKKLKRWLGQTVSSLSEKLRRIKKTLRAHTKYVWMDTVCIDKSNLSELDRAIRSMYKWYASCAAVVLDSGTPLDAWCKRGWCLQEGAAAGVLCGISKNGSLVTIQELAIEQHLGLCTFDQLRYLCNLDLHLYYHPGNAVEIIARMDIRATTHEEDMAYALTGIFSIHLTLAYGEGFKSRERLFHELATKKGDLSFLSFQSTEMIFRNYLPNIGQANYLIAKCKEASAPVMVSHFGISFDVQLVKESEANLVLKKLKGWKDLNFAKNRSIGVGELIEMAESQETQSSVSVKFAIVHYIRSIMLVETYDKDLQTGGAGRQIERCHRLQCCQIEEREFTRLFEEDGTKLERIWLRDKPDGVGANMITSG